MIIDIEFIQSRVNELTLQELTDVNNATVDLTVIETLISDSETVVNSYINKIYNLPLSVEHELLKLICFSITLYKLYQLRYANEMHADISNQYNEAKSLLNKIATLEIELTGESKKANSELFFNVSSRSSRINSGWFQL
jgi:phage gp36-like protein